MDPFFHEMDLNLNEAEIHLNHYQIQSLDYFQRVKQKRGDADLLLLIPDGYKHAEFHISRYRRFLSAVHFRHSRKEDLGLLPSTLGNWKNENVIMVMSLLEEPGPSQWKQFEFVLERTLLTGKTVRLKPMGGIPVPRLIFLPRVQKKKNTREFIMMKRD